MGTAEGGSRPRVVVVGAGFGGLQAARSLAEEPVDVVVVDRNNYHGFWPLLYQVSAGQVEAGQVGYPVRSVMRKAGNVDFQLMDVERVDRERKAVVGGGSRLSYDYLILAPGSEASYLGVDGAREHTLPFKTMDHGLAIRNRILGQFEEAVSTRDPEERERLLTFVMIGGGPTGVELAGALAELVRRTFPGDYPRLDMGEVRIVLLEALERLLPAFSDRAGSYAHTRLSELGVHVKLGAMVEAVERGRVLLEGGESIRAGTVVWTAGVAGSGLAEAADLPTTKKGTIPVDEHLRAEGDAALYVVGDCAHFESGDEPLPMVAQVAIQQGRHAAGNILRQARGEPLKPFQYRDLGMMAVIGRGRAVVQREPVTLTGALAWPIWALVHIGKLVGFRNRLLVMVNWAASYVFSRPGVRLILPRTPNPDDEPDRGGADQPAG